MPDQGQCAGTGLRVSRAQLRAAAIPLDHRDLWGEAPTPVYRGEDVGTGETLLLGQRFRSTRSGEAEMKRERSDVSPLSRPSTPIGRAVPKLAVGYGADV